MHLQVLRKVLQPDAISTLVFLLDLGVFQVTPSSHKAVDLVVEPLNGRRNCEGSFELVDSFLVFVFRWQHAVWDIDVLRISRVNHGRVSDSDCFEGHGARGESDGNDFATPTVATYTPGLDVGVILFEFFNELGDLCSCLLRGASCLEELAYFLLLVFVGRRKPIFEA